MVRLTVKHPPKTGNAYFLYGFVVFSTSYIPCFISLHDVGHLLLGILNIYLCRVYLHDVVRHFQPKKVFCF